MKWRTADNPREYYQKYEKIELKNDGNGWFQAYQLPGDVVALCEPQHFQEVNAFIIKGSKSALLIDTGMGICNIEPAVREIWPGDIEVVNTHCHFDHVGNNWRFPHICVANSDFVLRQAQEGVPCLPLSNQMEEDMFVFGYPEELDPDNYSIKPYKIKVVEDGHIFDLGDRQVEVIYTPGHCEDHLMLFDHKEKILFSGDMIYLGAIYVQFGNEVMGYSDLEQYISSLEKIQTRCPEIKAVYTSHNDFIMPPECVTMIREAMVAVRDHQVEGEPLVDEKYGYYKDPETMKQYQFDGFSIVYSM